MVILCCIDFCPNRVCKSDSVETENHVTLFSFPDKQSERCKQWFDAVEPYIKKGNPTRKNLYICQHHFDDSFFIKENTKIWRDGIRVTIPRKKLQLKKNAVPSIFNVPENVENGVIIESKEATRTTSPLYTKEDLIRDWKNIPENSCLAENWGMVHFKSSSLNFVYYGNVNKESNVTISVTVEDNMTTKLYVRGRQSTFSIIEKITCFEDMTSILEKVTCLRLCEDISCSSGLFQPKLRSSNMRCKFCQRKKENNVRKERARLKRLIDRKMKNKKIKNTLKQKCCRSEEKIESLKTEVDEVMAKCALANEVNLDEIINCCPKEMQEAIKTCHRYANLTDKRGMRYTKEWILECLLLRIKSQKGYLHLKDHNILALPTIQTLNSYLKKLKSTCGFDLSVFEMLKK